MPDLIILVPSLRQGGAEKFSVNLYNSLSKNESVELISISNEGSFYDLIKDKSNVVRLGYRRVIKSTYRLLKELRIRKPKTILTMFLHLSAIILTFKALGLIKSNIVIREVNLPSQLLKKKNFPFIYKLVYRYLYPVADSVICQSFDMYQELKTYTSANLTIINNPIDTAAVNKMASDPVNIELYKVNADKINLVFIGRLTFQKGIDLLVEFASKLNENCLLHIVGGGELDEWLAAKLKELNLGSRVIMHGTLNNPFPLLAKANFMIMSSRYEGFPNVALESLSLGVPIVAMPFSGGGKEIFIPGKNSVLAMEITGESLFSAFKDAAHLEFSGEYIKKSTFEKFDVSIISAIYRQELF